MLLILLGLYIYCCVFFWVLLRLVIMHEKYAVLFICCLLFSFFLFFGLIVDMSTFVIYFTVLRICVAIIIFGNFFKKTE
jgi:hypothetical protein